MATDKEIRWMGSSYDDILSFPSDARREAGFQLGKVQAGLVPDDWKPFDDVGPGTREIRMTEVTTMRDKEVASARYRAIINTRRARK